MLPPTMEYYLLQNGFRPKKDAPLMESSSKWIQTVCKTPHTFFNTLGATDGSSYTTSSATHRTALKVLNGLATNSFSTSVHLKGIAEDDLSHC